MFKDDENTTEARTKKLEELLQIDFNKFGTPLSGLFEPTNDNPHHRDVIVIDAIPVPDQMPSTTPYFGLEAWLNRRKEINNSIVFGLEPETLRVVATVQAIKCANESDRINANECKSLLEDPKTKVEASSYISGCVRQFYQKDYETRLAEKTRQEEEIKLQRHVKDLATIDDYLCAYSFKVCSTI